MWRARPRRGEGAHDPGLPCEGAWLPRVPSNLIPVLTDPSGVVGRRGRRLRCPRTSRTRRAPGSPHAVAGVRPERFGGGGYGMEVSMPEKTLGTMLTRRTVARRTLLKGVGVGLAAISLAPALSACGMLPGGGGDKLTVWTDATFAPPSDDYQTEEIQKWAKAKNVEVEVTREG